MIGAHIFGLPIEETVPQFAQVGIVAVVALQLIRARTRRLFRRDMRRADENGGS